MGTDTLLDIIATDMVDLAYDPTVHKLPIAALTRDVKKAADTLSRQEARYMVDLFRQIQDYRIQSGNQITSMLDEPHELFTFMAGQMATLERQIQATLDRWSLADPLGQWARAQRGVGPVIAAGLLAHIDLDKAPTVGHIWRFAGLDPTVVWNKGEKRPWNADLKVLCWKLGESFTKVSGHPDGYYGHIYKNRKAIELERNAAGDFADQAAQVLATRKIGKETDAYAAYSVGKLPPAHIHARAKRYAVKMFLSHYHEIGYELMGKTPPKPFAIAHMEHAHYIPPPR